MGARIFLEELLAVENPSTGLADHRARLKKLGWSVDRHRLRFTMDEGFGRGQWSVAFNHLYERGLIYHGKYIVNWCPRCQTRGKDKRWTTRTTTANCGT